MTDSIQDRVFAFVAQETCVRREMLTAKTTLARDIGLDGLPAIEFFDAFRWEFSVDLKDLQSSWDSYFVEEGMPLRNAFLIAIPSLFLGFLLVHIAPRMPAWGWYVLAFGIWLAFLRCLSNWRHEVRVPQVAIQDLIDSAKLGKWAKEPPPGGASGAVASGWDAGIFQR